MENKSYLTLQLVCSPVFPAAHLELPMTAIETNSSLAIRQEKGPAHILYQDKDEEVNAVPSQEVKAAPCYLQRVSYDFSTQLP